jgi:hypothetical protein
MFLEIRVFGENRSERFTEAKSENLPLGDFKHVVIDNLRNIKISPSETNHIHFVAYHDTTNINISYVVENDTLKISGIASSPRNSSYTLYAAATIESISVNNSYIKISGLDQDSICLKVLESEVSTSRSSEKDVSNFKIAKIMGLNSKIYLWDAKIDDLALEIENSRAEFRMDINTVNATIKSKSQLHLKNVEKLELVKDEDSRIFMR